ncbi:MAG: MBL fold metallo-hydrolase [Patulibacter sp.]|nr:MBL fold metallo-hydrolase [Patulibacter sp.]
MPHPAPGPPPDGPTAEPVAPGTWRVTFQADAAFGGSTNAYLTETDDGLALVDAGIPGDRSVAQLDGALAELGATSADVRRILLTHGHWDHCGLVPVLRARHDTPVALHAADLAIVQRGHVSSAQWDADWDRWLDELGAPEAPRPELLVRAHKMRGDAIDVAPDDLITADFRAALRDGEVETILTPGHSAGHVVFVDRGRGILFAGDHVLPTINPNVSCLPGSEPDPLTSYLRSLAAVRELDVQVALPGHGDPFGDLRDRVDALRAGRERRLAAVEALVAESRPSTVWELAQRYAWRVAWDEMNAITQLGALGETYAHLTCLRTAGRLVRDDAGRYHAA